MNAKMKVQNGKVDVQQAARITSYLGKLVNDHGYESSIYYSLHLLLVTCCYIGQEPHCLLQGTTDTSQMSEISGLIYEIRQVNVWVSSSCLSHLVDLLFGVCEQVGKVREDITVEHHLSLLIRPCYNVPHRSQRCGLSRGYTNIFKKCLCVCVFYVYKWYLTYMVLFLPEL